MAPQKSSPRAKPLSLEKFLVTDPRRHRSQHAPLSSASFLHQTFDPSIHLSIIHQSPLCRYISVPHLSRATHSQLHEMIHESLQADVVGEDGLGRLGDAAVARGRGVRRGRVELGE